MLSVPGQPISWGILARAFILSIPSAILQLRTTVRNGGGEIAGMSRACDGPWQPPHTWPSGSVGR
eukprot:7165041-Pyramimonas_sp.AAC.1